MTKEAPCDGTSGKATSTCYLYKLYMQWLTWPGAQLKSHICHEELVVSMQIMIHYSGWTCLHVGIDSFEYDAKALSFVLLGIEKTKKIFDSAGS